MIAAVTLDSISELGFDGPITGFTTIVLALVIAIVMALVLWMERRIIGRAWAIAFGLLRFAALAGACWMLLQPCVVKRETSVRTRSVAILADRSGSMETVDHQLTSQMLPWIDREDVTSNSADRAALDLRVAARLIRTNWLESATLSKQAVSVVLQRFDLATSRCEQHLTTLIEAVNKSSPIAADRVASILDEVRNAVFDRKKLTTEQSESNQTNVSRFADRIVETLEQQASDLDAIILKLQRDRIVQNDSFTAKPRKEFVSQWLGELETELLTDLSRNAKIKRATFDANVQSMADNDWAGSMANDVDPAGRTDLSGALSWLQPTAITDRLAAVFLISEGGHNADSKLTPVAASRTLGDVPVLGVGIGNSQPSRDLVLHQVRVPRVVYEDDDIKIDAIISGYDFEGESAEVVLKQGAKEVERKTIEIDSPLSDANVQFRVPAGTLGLREFQLAILPIEGEVTEKNNVSAFSVETIRGKTRVLLADLDTRWEYRYLQILFSRDEHVQADEFLRFPVQHATGRLEELGRLPETIEEWAFYDVVLIGDLNLTKASQDSLAKYVRERAGKVIIIAGKNHMPAAYASQPFFDLLPIQSRPATSQPFDPLITITQEGATHPAMLVEATPHASRDRWRLASSRATLGYLSPWNAPRDSARVLAALQSDTVDADSSESAAWLCWHRVGAGQVVYLTAPSAYKLRFRAGDIYHHRFWGQMLRWLMAADLASDQQLVQLRTDQSNYVQNDIVQVIAHLRTPQGFAETGGEVSVAISANGRPPRMVALQEDESMLGTYRAEIQDLQPDVYQLKPTGRSVERLIAASPEAPPSQSIITVEQVGDIEQVLTSANYPLMAEIAAATGGQLLTPAAAEEVFSLLPIQEQGKTIEERTPIWNRWSLLWLVAGCLSTEWLARKWKGLV